MHRRVWCLVQTAHYNRTARRPAFRNRKVRSHSSATTYDGSRYWAQVLQTTVEIEESLSLFGAPPRCRRKAFCVRSLSIVLRICSSTHMGSIKGGVGIKRPDSKRNWSGLSKTGISGYGSTTRKGCTPVCCSLCITKGQKDMKNGLSNVE